MKNFLRYGSLHLSPLQNKIAYVSCRLCSTGSSRGGMKQSAIQIARAYMLLSIILRDTFHGHDKGLDRLRHSFATHALGPVNLLFLARPPRSPEAAARLGPVEASSAVLLQALGGDT
jgi:hypothetical protein